jgi:hypothetical protein
LFKIKNLKKIPSFFERFLKYLLWNLKLFSVSIYSFEFVINETTKIISNVNYCRFGLFFSKTPTFYLLFRKNF